jgi:hypothetical protein
MRLFRHAGLEEPAPYLIRRHPEGLESTGFRLEFIPTKIGAGMTTFVKLAAVGSGSISIVVTVSRQSAPYIPLLSKSSITLFSNYLDHLLIVGSLKNTGWGFTLSSRAVHILDINACIGNPFCNLL